MKTFIVFAAAVAVAFAAPSPGSDGKVYELRRTKKSNGAQSYGGGAQSYGGGAPSYGGGALAYGGGAPSYGGGAPSYGGGAPAYGGGAPSYGGGAPSYGGGAPCGGGAPVALYLTPQHQQQGPHYREDESETEHEHASARSYYDGASGALAGLPAPGLAAPGLAGLNLAPAPASAGPAVGVFPGAKLGGCAVPLLLSCAPTVVSGHVAKSHGSGYGSSAGSYGPGAAASYGSAAAAASYGSAAAPAYKEAEEMSHEKAWSKARDSHKEMKEAGVQGWPKTHAARDSHQDAAHHQINHETAHASANKL